MVNVCVEIETTRDIARQILRHRSFSFQEFSQRYATPLDNLEMDYREVRMQDTKNRQNSLELDLSQPEQRELHDIWLYKQAALMREAKEAYHWAVSNGIAKEQARAVLPEGNTMSRMYMNGTLRSWLHYVNIRCDKATQKEHRLIAEQCRDILYALFPSIKEVTT